MSSFEQRFSNIRTKFTLNPKLGALSSFLMDLEQVIDPDFPHLAAVSTKQLYINPVKCNELSDDELLGLLAHEIYHNVLMHNVRFENEKCPQRRHILNIAMDVVINLKLINEGFSLPLKGGVLHELPDKFGIDPEQYRDLSTEEVFNSLIKRLPESASSSSADDLLGKKDDPRPDQMIQTDVAARLLSTPGAAGLADGFADLRDIIDKFKKPTYNWKQLLLQYMVPYASKDEYTYSKPNPLYYPDLFLPSLIGEHTENLAVFMDTSGSVSDELLKKILSTASGMRDLVEPEKTFIGCFDTKLHNVQEYDQYDSIQKYKTAGGGGTNPEVVMNWINENRPAVTVIFTDGEFWKTPTKPKHDVIWVIYDNPNFTCPFGKVVIYDESFES